MWTGFKADEKLKRRATRNKLHSEFHIPDLKNKRLLKLDSNFNTKSDHYSLTDQFYVVPLKYNIVGHQNNSFNQKITKKAQVY